MIKSTEKRVAFVQEFPKTSCTFAHDPLSEPMHLIDAYCHINSKKIALNGQPLLTNTDQLPVNDFLKLAYKSLSIEYPKFYKMDKLCKAAFLAGELLVGQKPFPEDTALVFANRSASLVSDATHAQALYNEAAAVSPAVFVYTLPNIVLGELSIRHQLHSENVFFIFDRFKPDFMVSYQEMVLNDNRASQILGGWAEVNETQLDIFLYRIGVQGTIEHSIENLQKLYQENHE